MTYLGAEAEQPPRCFKTMIARSDLSESSEDVTPNRASVLSAPAYGWPAPSVERATYPAGEHGDGGAWRSDNAPFAACGDAGVDAAEQVRQTSERQ